jgi:hypothetical protein
MIKRHHNKAVRRIERDRFDKLRGYVGESRYKRRVAFARALILDNGGRL